MKTSAYNIVMRSVAGMFSFCFDVGLNEFQMEAGSI